MKIIKHDIECDPEKMSGAIVFRGAECALPKRASVTNEQEKETKSIEKFFRALPQSISWDGFTCL